MTKRKGPLGKLKRLPTFTVSEGEVQFGLRTVDPTFRSSLSRLIGSTPSNASDGTSSPGAETRFAASFERQFRQEWQRIRDAVHDVFQYKNEEKKVNTQVLPRGHLTSLHNDIRILLRSQAGTFIFEYYQNTLLPAASTQLLELLENSGQNFGTTLVAVWTHFYCNVLPTLEAIFIQVKNQKMSVRQATLLAFRDHVILKLEPNLESTLEDMYARGSVHPSIKQMLLVLQSVMECYPPSDERLKLESLISRVVSPYLGHKGIYEDGYLEPVVTSRELEVAHLRRPSVEDPRRLSRPLSVNTGSNNLETLSDLFELSATRAVQKRVVLYVTMTLGVALYCFYAYETLEDLIENISILATQMSLSARLYVLVVYRNELLFLIKTVANNFYVSGEEEKQMVISTIKFTRKMSRSIFILYVLTTVAMVSHPLTSQDRILPFNTWYPYVNLTESPYYEVLYASQAGLTVMIGWFAGAMDTLCISLVFFCALQFRLVAHGLRKSQDIKELRTCIQYHQAVILYMNKTCTALNPIFIVQLLCTNLLICLLGFQAMAMESHGIKIVRVVLHLTCSIFQIGIMCFFGQHITTESGAIYDAAYESSWYEQSPAFKSMLWMVVERARKPAALSAGLFGELSLLLFYAVMRSSYSYITLLSQFNEEDSS